MWLRRWRLFWQVIFRGLYRIGAVVAWAVGRMLTYLPMPHAVRVWLLTHLVVLCLWLAGVQQPVAMVNVLLGAQQQPHNDDPDSDETDYF